MIIARKMEIFVCEQDEKLKKEHVRTLYNLRYWVRKAANIVVAHKFAQDNIAEFIYLKDEVKERLFAKDIIKEGKGFSETNATYRVLASISKGEIPSQIYNSLNKTLVDTYKKTCSDIRTGKASLRTYKNFIPIPFDAKAIRNLRFEDCVSQNGNKYKGCFFSLFKIPFQIKFGRDHSGNRYVIERCLSGEYKICGSSYSIEQKTNKETGKKANKIFLNLSINKPESKTKLQKGKTMYAFLGVFNPITCTTEVNTPETYKLHKMARDIKSLEKTLKNLNDDNARREIEARIDVLTLEAKLLDIDTKKKMEVWEIGTKEEFNYRRRQIQELCERTQKECRYSVGGKGRKRKLQALERFKDKERNYVDSKLHLYSRRLVDLAVKHECDTIYLMKQEEREEKAKTDSAKGDPFVLRNWTYYDLKTKIKYKAAMFGISVKSDKDDKDDNENED